MDNGNGTEALRFLVAGCGSIGKRHIKNLRALGIGEIFGCDVRPDRRAEVKAQLGIDSLESLDAAWALQPDAVVIASPTALHMPSALEAAQHRAHLFIEKPLASSWDGVERLIGLTRQNGLVSLVGCNMRFHPGLITVKRLLIEEAVGPIIAARVEAGQHLPDWHPWEDYRQTYSARAALGGGVILDAIHEIDYIRWLIGEVSGLFCLAGKLSHLEIDTEDTAALLLRFENGALGEVHLDYIQRAYSRSCQIIGEEGTIYWDYMAGQVRWYSARAKGWQCFANPAGWEANQMYLDEMRHFVDCLAGRAVPEQDVLQGARALAIALAAKSSAVDPRWIQLGDRSWKAALI
ncbi:MAG TPA: Gfo/Idh/MocA family oxidoreductase [Candidatus Binatia bacterium]|nr:Gfo/Idh/MocA family oxidoreductase [Candidatus Binatia bacterium]